MSLLHSWCLTGLYGQTWKPLDTNCATCCPVLGVTRLCESTEAFCIVIAMRHTYVDMFYVL